METMEIFKKVNNKFDSFYMVMKEKLFYLMQEYCELTNTIDSTYSVTIVDKTLNKVIRISYKRFGYGYGIVDDKGKEISLELIRMAITHLEDILVILKYLAPYRDEIEGGISFETSYCIDHKPISNKVFEGKTIESVFIAYYKASKEIPRTENAYYQFKDEYIRQQYLKWLDIIPYSFMREIIEGR